MRVNDATDPSNDATIAGPDASSQRASHARRRQLRQVGHRRHRLDEGDGGIVQNRKSSSVSASAKKRVRRSQPAGARTFGQYMSAGSTAPARRGSEPRGRRAPATTRRRSRARRLPLSIQHEEARVDAISSPQHVWRAPSRRRAAPHEPAGASPTAAAPTAPAAPRAATPAPSSRLLRDQPRAQVGRRRRRPRRARRRKVVPARPPPPAAAAARPPSAPYARTSSALASVRNLAPAATWSTARAAGSRRKRTTSRSARARIGVAEVSPTPDAVVQTRGGEKLLAPRTHRLQAAEEPRRVDDLVSHAVQETARWWTPISAASQAWRENDVRRPLVLRRFSEEVCAVRSTIITADAREPRRARRDALDGQRWSRPLLVLRAGVAEEAAFAVARGGRLLHALPEVGRAHPVEQRPLVAVEQRRRRVAQNATRAHKPSRAPLADRVGAVAEGAVEVEEALCAVELSICAAADAAAAASASSVAIGVGERRGARARALRGERRRRTARVRRRLSAAAARTRA